METKVATVSVFRSDFEEVRDVFESFTFVSLGLSIHFYSTNPHAIGVVLWVYKTRSVREGTEIQLPIPGVDHISAHV